MNKNYIFISYAREDYKSADRIYNDLKDAGFKPWLDKKDLLPGTKWRQTIESIINDSKYFIALFSKRSLTKRGYVQKELKLALNVADTLPGDDIFIIPARLDNCRPNDPAINMIHRVDLFPTYEEGLKRILKALKAEEVNSINFDNNEQYNSQPNDHDINAVNLDNNKSYNKNFEKTSFIITKTCLDKLKKCQYLLIL